MSLVLVFKGSRSSDPVRGLWTFIPDSLSSWTLSTMTSNNSTAVLLTSSKKYLCSAAEESMERKICRAVRFAVEIEIVGSITGRK